MRGLLVIEPLFHAIVAGRKTQTRRSGGLNAVNYRFETYIDQDGKKRKKKIFCADDWEKAAISIYANKWGGLASQGFMKKGGGLIPFVNPEINCKPRYKIGEVLYLKEPYMGQNGHYSYKFDLKPDSPLRNGNGTTVVWKNKLFMPADAGRNFIRITGIKCERLLDISDQDCVAEGIIWQSPEITDKIQVRRYFDYKENQFKAIAPQTSFLSLFKFANKVKEVPNLWVWRYEFAYLTNYIKP